MEFFHAAFAVLAGVVLLLAALVAWLYIQQSRTIQALNTLALAITAPPLPPSAEVHQVHVDTAAVPVVAEVVRVDETDGHDDRVSVHEEEEDASTVEESTVIEKPATSVVDEDEFASKTVPQLRELLTAKGIPYNKKDSKPLLISLLKAIS
jgi:hypothetical protein